MHKTTKPTGIGPKIKELKLLEPNLTNRQIGARLGCTNSTVCYHLNPISRQKRINEARKREKSHPYISKVKTFKLLRGKAYKKVYQPTNPSFYGCIQVKTLNFSTIKIKGKFVRVKAEFNANDVIAKFGENPKCYLSGEEIDIMKTRSYNFDHVIPRSRGGDNSLDNLQIVTKKINQAKLDMTPDEFIYMCKQVLEYNGFEVNKLVDHVGTAPTLTP